MRGENMFNPRAFSHFNDGKYSNWDGVTHIWTWDFIKSIETVLLGEMDNIKTIFDIGSRDGCQALELNDWFEGSTIYLFEPVPTAIRWIEKNIKSRPNLHLIPQAVNNFDGYVPFYEVTNGNIGASSILKSHNPCFRTNLIQVPCTRIDTFMRQYNVPDIDLLWVDVEGAEKRVFSSFAGCLNSVKAIGTEVSLRNIFEGTILKNELDKLLDKMGFVFISGQATPDGNQMDCVYVNKKYVPAGTR
jgi:FkbM family methyltransferase